MPHIEIKMYPGRSEEIKRYCRKDKRLSCKRNEYGNKILSVSVKEIEKEQWQEEVVEKHQKKKCM